MRRMVATGNVTLTNGTEAAEAEHAAYEVAAGTIEMDGDVLLTQGRERAVERAAAASTSTPAPAQLEGRVQTIFVPGSQP